MDVQERQERALYKPPHHDADQGSETHVKKPSSSSGHRYKVNSIIFIDKLLFVKNFFVKNFNLIIVLQYLNLICSFLYFIIIILNVIKAPSSKSRTENDGKEKKRHSKSSKESSKDNDRWQMSTD